MSTSISTNASPNPVPTSIKVWTVMKQGDQDLVPFEFTHPDALAANDVKIQVESCGVCHTDLTMLENGWGMTTFPPPSAASGPSSGKAPEASTY